MAAESELIELISGLDHAGLLTLWEQIEARDTPNWPQGRAFEYLVLRAFQVAGATVRWPYSVHLHEEEVEQIDGAIYLERHGLSFLAESKDWSVAINIDTIAKLRNQLARRPAPVLGAVFSYNGFTEPARLLAQYLSPQTILLWDGSEVGYALTTGQMVEGMMKKYRAAVEYGISDYNLLEESA